MGAGGGVPDHLIGAASWYMTGGNERLERIVEDGFRKDEFEKIAEVLQRVNPLARRLRTFGAAANATAGGTEKNTCTSSTHPASVMIRRMKSQRL